ncbi:hypothetical protein ZWY2020_012449 [Hordeum vulgare]|nr:hypothetical protein ZWY2020_012449 [Hordeum vulgare]
MRHLPESLPAPCSARSVPPRQRLASSSTQASVELIHEARRRRREDWESVPAWPSFEDVVAWRCSCSTAQARIEHEEERDSPFS